MEDKGEKRLLLKTAKYVDKRLYKKLKRLWKEEDFIILARHSIYFNLHRRLEHYRHYANKLIERGEDIFDAELDILKAEYGIKVFKADCSLGDTRRILRLFGKIERELRQTAHKHIARHRRK